MKHFALGLLFIVLFASLKASKVDTVAVYSSSMKKNIKTCIVIPDNYEKKGKPCPVVYLLHGYSGNYAYWVKNYPLLAQSSDMYNMIIVCADGAYSSWYLDSPVDPSMKYETYVATELVSYIDKNFNTIKDPKGRAISGLSMGGYGSLYLAIRHQDVFGACGSMSGGVDLRPFPENWDLAKRLGNMDSFPGNWEQNIISSQLYRLKNGSLRMTIDCGVDDFFIAVNRDLHQRMLYLNIKHDYTERPGAHTLQYWRNSLQYHLLFFNNFFSEYSAG